jgi:uncharacterized membrane protein
MEKVKKINKRVGCKKWCLESFTSDEVCNEYYKARKHYMIRIYLLMIIAKVGHIMVLVSTITYIRRDVDPRLEQLYPLTEEGDSEFMAVTIKTIA